MFHFLLIFTAIFAISIANETIKQLETIKGSLHEQEKAFLKELPTAEAASSQKYEELAEKFKQFEEQCKTLDALLRTKFDMPELLSHLNPAKRFDMETFYKEKSICDEFLKLDVHERFELASRQHQLNQLEFKLDDIQETTNLDMQMLSGLKMNSIQQLIEHYDKVGKAVVEMENSLEKLQNPSQKELVKVKDFLKTECKALKELISKEFNLPDKVVPQKQFKTILSRRCNDVLHTIGNAEQQAEKIENLNELLQSIKKMVGSESHLTESRKLLEDAKKNLDKKVLENLIQTYHHIGKANTEVKGILHECKQLYFHDENKAPIQIKYFLELTKAGQEFAENLRNCLHDGKSAEQKSALKKEKDEFVKKLTSWIRYNGSKHKGADFISYADAYQLEHSNVDENRKRIFGYVELHSIVPEILDAEKETMENALQLLKVYKQEIGPIEEKNSHTSAKH